MGRIRAFFCSDSNIICRPWFRGSLWSLPLAARALVYQKKTLPHGECALQSRSGHQTILSRPPSVAVIRQLHTVAVAAHVIQNQRGMQIVVRRHDSDEKGIDIREWHSRFEAFRLLLHLKFKIRISLVMAFGWWRASCRQSPRIQWLLQTTDRLLKVTHKRHDVVQQFERFAGALDGV